MAKIQRFNPPPNWPTPPEGWSPPPNWQPDPSWGQSPEGWQYWVSERANPRAWVFSLVSAAGLYVVFLVIALVATGGALGASGTGALFSPYLIAGIVTGAVAWSARSRWPIWLYPLVVLGIAIGFTLLSSIGRIAPST
jgi:hypothetical protein